MTLTLRLRNSYDHDYYFEGDGYEKTIDSIDGFPILAPRGYPKMLTFKNDDTLLIVKVAETNTMGYFVDLKPRPERASSGNNSRSKC